MAIASPSSTGPDQRRTALVAKPEWGTKRTCQACGVKFYDLGHAPIECPKCGVEYDPEALLKSRRGRAALAPERREPAEVRKPPKPAVEEEEEAGLEEDLEVLEEADEEEDLIEDASELGEDDDMSEVQGLEGEEEEP
jgi:uncharacterized protein (TIGR02300 family)